MRLRFCHPRAAFAPAWLGRALPAAGLGAALLMAGCTSAPPRTAGEASPERAPTRPADRPGRVAPAPERPLDPTRDGPEAQPPPGLMDVPDAQPRLEPLRPGGPNKPYQVLGQAYTPLAGDPPLIERGLASWYGRKFHGRATANGESYNMYAMTAAHKTMPLPSYARVRNPANGREVVLRINDRGPFHPGRVIDLSYTAALKLGVLGGVAPVEVERITYEAIRSGSWRAPAATGTALASAAADTSERAPVPVVQAEPTRARPARSAPADGLDDPIGELLRRTAEQPSAAAVAAAAPAPTSQPQPLPAETAAPAQAALKAAPGFWLQLGAFSQRDGAMSFQQRVAVEAAWLAPLLAVFNEGSLHRLQAGPYASRADAQGAAQRLREALQLVPAVVQRR